VATVTGYTAAKMQEIVDGTVESGYINGSGHLILVLHDATEIDAGSALPALPTASDTVAGIVELATNAETITGTDATRAVTPASLAAASTTLVPAASDTVAGRVELATSAETITGTDTVRAVTPAGFAAGFDSRLGTKGLDALSDVIITSAAIGHILQHDGSTFVNKATLDLIGAAAGTDVLSVKVTGDTNVRTVINGDGSIEFGSGAAAVNIKIYRYADNILGIDDGIMMTDPTKQLNIGNSGSTAIIAVKASATSDAVFTTRAGASADSYFYMDALGDHWWGNGTATQEIQLGRTANNALSLQTADFLIATAGRGLRIKEGSNAKMGSGTLVGGTLTVNTTAVTANSRIFAFCNSPGGTPGFLRCSARVAGTSFTILSSSGTDTSTFSWILIEPA